MSSIDEMAELINEYMSNFSEDVNEGIKGAVDIVAKEVNEEIKSHVTFEEPTKKYVKAFRIKNVFEGRFNKGKTWHVANGQYRLTHLLENGHAKIGGGRTRAYKHIEFGNDLAVRRMQELSEEAVKNASN